MIGRGAMGDGERVQLLDTAVRSLEGAEGLDPVGRALDSLTSPLVSGPVTSFLRGDWLGHAFHPLMTDFPLGCWTAAGLLDLSGSERTREASRRLVGLGLLATPLTVAAGLAEWRLLDSASSRRVAGVHALGNVFAAIAYLISWRRRRAGRHASGVAWAMVGGLTALATGYLGGHLSFVRGAGSGWRGRSPVGSGGLASALRRVGSRLTSGVA